MTFTLPLSLAKGDATCRFNRPAQHVPGSAASILDDVNADIYKKHLLCYAPGWFFVSR
jgi:hypothetical protein